MLTKTPLRIPFYVIGRCSLVPTSHWQQGKCARINTSQAASGMILQSHRRLPTRILGVKKSPLQGLLSGLLEVFQIFFLFKISK
jgi:hypothetical protein